MRIAESALVVDGQLRAASWLTADASMFEGLARPAAAADRRSTNGSITHAESNRIAHSCIPIRRRCLFVRAVRFG